MYKNIYRQKSNYINDVLVTQSKERQFKELIITYNFLQNSIKLGFYKYSIIYQNMPILTHVTEKQRLSSILHYAR